MALIDKRILETRMMEIERARPLGTRVISKFEQLIRDGDDLSLYRINPLAFARDRTIGAAESIDLFLHARQKRRRAAVQYGTALLGRSRYLESSWPPSTPTSDTLVTALFNR